MFEQIAAMIADQLGIDASTIKPESRLVEDLKADSLDVVAMIMEMESEFGIEIPDEELTQLHTVADAMKYKTEPYAVAADVCAADRLSGRGGWSWYTGSAAWMYRIIVEDLLGIKCHKGKLIIDPNLPSSWHSYRLKGLIGGEKIDRMINRESKQS